MLEYNFNIWVKGAKVTSSRNWGSSKDNINIIIEGDFK
jgi:hypothetical protein